MLPGPATDKFKFVGNGRGNRLSAITAGSIAAKPVGLPEGKSGKPLNVVEYRRNKLRRLRNGE